MNRIDNYLTSEQVIDAPRFRVVWHGGFELAPNDCVSRRIVAECYFTEQSDAMREYQRSDNPSTHVSLYRIKPDGTESLLCSGYR